MERVVDEGLVREAGGVEGSGPDGHLALVDEDRQQVGADADRRDLEPGDAPVLPEPGEDEDVGADVGPADGDVRPDAGLPTQPGEDPEGEGQDQEDRPAQPEIGEAGEAAPGHRAHDERQEDGAKEHLPRPAWAASLAPGARLVAGACGASTAARPRDPAGDPGSRGRGRPGWERSAGRTGCR